MSEVSCATRVSADGAAAVWAVGRTQLFALARRPAIWTIWVAAAALTQIFSYLIPYLSYRSGGSGGFRTRGESAAEMLAGTLPGQLVPNTIGGFPIFAGALTLAFGALVFGSDYGWDTVKTLLTQGPSRSSILAGQLAAMATWVVVSVCALFLLSGLSATLIAWREGQSIAFASLGHISLGIASGSLILVMWASIGAALAVVLRSVALPIGLGIVWALGIENILSALADSMLSGLDTLRNVLPGVNAGSLVAAVSPERIGAAAPGVSTTVAGGRALGTVLVYVAIAWAVSIWLSCRRDVT